MKSRIVQITDLHLTETPDTELYGVDTGTSLKSIISEVKSLSEKPKMIIATGDLVENGSKASYLRLGSILEEFEIPVFALPGNHDDLTNMHDSLSSQRISCVDYFEAGDWRCILVNSQVEGHSHGNVSSAELSKIRDIVSEFEDHPVLVAIHHTPSNVCPSFGCQLENSIEFTALLNNFTNVKAVIAGHTHTEFESQAGNHVQYTTPSTFAHATHAQRGEPVNHDDFWDSHCLDGTLKGFRVLDLYSDGSVQSKVHWLRD